MTETSRKPSNNLAHAIEQAIQSGPIIQSHVCTFCGKQFARESTLFVHICEPKRRHGQRDAVGVRIAYTAYADFYMETERNPKTYSDFCASQFYNAFVRFGDYCVAVGTIDSGAYSRWLIKHRKRIDKWCTDRFYDEWLTEHLREESLAIAIERSVIRAQDWASEIDTAPSEYFRECASNVICSDILKGATSPWFLYAAPSGIEWLENINTDQFKLIAKLVDPQHWEDRINRHRSDYVDMRTILSNGGF